jgi:pilus assembly protein CpaD
MPFALLAPTLRGLALGLCLLPIAACDGDPRPTVSLTNGADLPEARALIDQIQYSVPFEGSALAPSPRELDRLALFLDSHGVRPDDRLHLIAAPGADAQATQARFAALARALGDRGLTVTPPRTTAGLMAATPGTLTVVARRYEIRLPDCPDWSDPIIGKWSNQAHSNFGCATATNLGLMVEDPHDLIEGRTLGAMDGRVAARNSRAYLEGGSASNTGQNAGYTIFGL